MNSLDLNHTLKGSHHQYKTYRMAKLLNGSLPSERLGAETGITHRVQYISSDQIS